MAKDEREEEHEFLEGLKGRTGRDLTEWMTAIAVQGFTDKNEIIDWLRAQGLPFARASWLERIHRNGGRPIHSEAPVSEAPEPPRPTGPTRGLQVRPPAKAAPPGDTTGLERLLSAAKGYRPLYHLLEACVREAVPGAVFSAQARHVSVGAPAELAAITLHATEVRLGLALGDRPFDGTLQKAKLRGPGPGITHMLILTDARQVNENLAALIRAANGRVNA
jgi:hypothetical protein